MIILAAGFVAGAIILSVAFLMGVQLHHEILSSNNRKDASLLRHIVSLQTRVSRVEQATSYHTLLLDKFDP